VRWVALLDTTLNDMADGRDSDGEAAGENHGITLRDVVQWMTALSPDEIARRYGPDIEALRQRVVGVVQRDGVDAFVQALREAPDHLESEVDFPRALQRQLLDYHHAMTFGMAMTKQFTPAPIFAPVHALWSEETLQRGVSRDAWLRYTQDGRRSSSSVLQARHFDFVLGANAGPLAARLDRIGRADAAALAGAPSRSQPRPDSEAEIRARTDLAREVS
jgi:hypothetical protein